MVLLLASLVMFASFYLLGAYELHGRKATHENMLHKRVLVASLIVMGIVALIVPDPLADQDTLLPILTALTALLGAITLLDIETGHLSDLLTALLALGGIGYEWQTTENLLAMLPALATGTGLLALGALLAGPYSKWRKRDMMGWGDVKFLFAAGLWLSPLQAPVFLIIAGLIGALVALAYKWRTGKCETPFAPALCLALLLCVIYGFGLPAL